MSLEIPVTPEMFRIFNFWDNDDDDDDDDNDDDESRSFVKLFLLGEYLKTLRHDKEEK